MDIKYSKAAAKTISRMDSATKQRVKVATERLPGGDTKCIIGKNITT